ncbi:MAG: hypothetical protein KJS64_03555 [Acidobacteria bacterium]|nr:hypothetical protein [Acidobacteriota bacterium]
MNWTRSAKINRSNEKALLEQSLDLQNLLATLDESGVHYLIVGGVAARAYGASRVTEDLDLVIERTDANLDNVSTALRAMNARLRVEGMTDEEAKSLPVHIDRHMLKSAGMTTWMTDFGPLDLLAGLESTDAGLKDFNALVNSSTVLQGVGFTLRVAGLSEIIEAKSLADRPKDREALPELRQLEQDS